MKAWVVTRGTQMVMDVQRDGKLIQQLLDLKASLDGILAGPFANEPAFTKVCCNSCCAWAAHPPARIHHVPGTVLHCYALRWLLQACAEHTSCRMQAPYPACPCRIAKAFAPCSTCQCSDSPAALAGGARCI